MRRLLLLLYVLLEEESQLFYAGLGVYTYRRHPLLLLQVLLQLLRGFEGVAP